MTLQSIIDGKKAWRTEMARVKALPPDYQIVYQEIQRYLYKVGPAELDQGIGLLSGLIDLFTEGAAAGKGVLQVTGPDVASFTDDLIKDCPTYADAYQQTVQDQISAAWLKSIQSKTKEQ